MYLISTLQEYFKATAERKLYKPNISLEFEFEERRHREHFMEVILNTDDLLYIPKRTLINEERTNKDSHHSFQLQTAFVHGFVAQLVLQKVARNTLEFRLH